MSIAGQDDSYDFGSGAGFYVNATAGEWSDNYRMYDYVTKELPDLVTSLFPVDPSRMSVTGHSMGGGERTMCEWISVSASIDWGIIKS